MNKKIISTVIAAAICLSSVSVVYADPKSAAEMLQRKSSYNEHLSAPHTREEAQKLVEETAMILSANADIAASVLDSDTQNKVSSYFDLAYSAIMNDSLQNADYDNAYHCLAAVKSLILSNISSKKLEAKESMNSYIDSLEAMQIGFIVEIDEYTHINELRVKLLEAVKSEDNAQSLKLISEISLKVAEYYYNRLPVFDKSSLEFNNNFTDVSESDWFYNAVSFVCSMSIFKGTSDTTFEPQTTMTRAMFITALSRTETVEGTFTSPYSDVASDSWYANAVGWAYEKGCLSWVSGNEFNPDSPITREEMVQTIYLCSQNYKLSDVEQKDITSFSDYTSVAQDKTDAFKWAYSAGIVNGNSDGTLNPKGTAKRCEVAQIFLNLFDFLQKK